MEQSNTEKHHAHPQQCQIRRDGTERIFLFVSSPLRLLLRAAAVSGAERDSRTHKGVALLKINFSMSAPAPVCSSEIKGRRLNNKEFNLEAINQFAEHFPADDPGRRRAAPASGRTSNRIERAEPIPPFISLRSLKGHKATN